MTKSEATEKMNDYPYVGLYFKNKITFKEYLVDHMSVNKVLDSDNYLIQCAFKPLIDDVAGRILVENIDYFNSAYVQINKPELK